MLRSSPPGVAQSQLSELNETSADIDDRDGRSDRSQQGRIGLQAAATWDASGDPRKAVGCAMQMQPEGVIIHGLIIEMRCAFDMRSRPGVVGWTRKSDLPLTRNCTTDLLLPCRWSPPPSIPSSTSIDQSTTVLFIHPASTAIHIHRKYMCILYRTSVSACACSTQYVRRVAY